MTKAEKLPRAKTCKACKHKFTPTQPLQYVCGLRCAISYANVLAEKRKALEASQSRRETKLRLAKFKTKSDWLKEAQTIFNKFIRIRDSDQPCISCKRFHTGQYHAGHYRSVGSAPHLRFNEENVQKQCSACNNYLSGNAIEFRRNLIGKIGVEAVEALESDDEPKHYTIDDIKAIKAKYKQLVLEITQTN